MDRIFELTVNTEHRYTKSEIGRKVNRSPNFIFQAWNELCETCTCNHPVKSHKQKCHYLTGTGQCECKEFIGKLKKSDTGFVIRTVPDRGIQSYEDIKKTNFVKIASVQRWIEGLKKSKVKNYKYMLTNFWRVCITLDVHPDIFLQEIETAEKMKDRFVMDLKDGKAVYIYNLKNKNPEKQSKINPQPYIETIRSFRTRNNKDIPKGYLAIDRIATDTYARIHLNDHEIRIVANFLFKINPLFARLFVIQHDLGVRINTLFKIRPIFEKKYTTIDDNTCYYWKVIIPEEKQNRNFEKIIYSKEAMAIVENLPNGKRLHNYTQIRTGKKEYVDALRLAYAAIGKISDRKEKWESYEIGTEEYFYVNDPSHVIRHSSVHKLMRITGNRRDVVSALFWDVPDTLKIYEKSSIDSILQQGLCLVCNPPPKEDNKYQRFCTLRHAILYYNGYYVDGKEDEK